MSDSPKKKKKKRKSSSSSSSSSKKKNKGVRHGDWVRKKDPNSGRFYYGNVKTLERVWIMPDEFRQAAEAAGVDPEAEPADAADSETKKKTADSSDDGNSGSNTLADEWLEGYDPKNKRKYYVNKNTGESRWTKPLAAAEVNAEDWISGRDPKTKRVYYFNKTTKETTWEKPPGYIDPAERGAGKSGGEGGKGGSSSSKADTDALAAAAARRKEAKKEKQAKAAKEAEDAAQAKIEKKKNKKRKSSSKKKRPPESGKSGDNQVWISGIDPKTDRVYYYNTATKETTWTKPSDYSAAAAAAAADKPGEAAKGKARLRTMSQEKIELSALPLEGLVEARKSGFSGFDGSMATTEGGGDGGNGDRRRRAGHRSNLSIGTKEAQDIIAGLGPGTVSQRRDSLEQQTSISSSSSNSNSSSSKGGDGDNPSSHNRVVSMLEDFKEIPPEMAATLPRPQNSIVPAFDKLVDGNVEGLHDALHAHRIRLGGLAIAPLKDLIRILGDGGNHVLDAGAAEYLENMKSGH